MTRYRSLAVLLLLVATACTGGDRGGDGRSPSRPNRERPPEGPALELSQAWAWLAPPPASAGMPSADGAGVALTSGHQHLVLLDAGGTVQWAVERPGLREVAPLLGSDTVVAATDAGVVAYQRATGRLRWEAALGERANTPVLAQGRAVVTTWEGSIVALDMATGRVAWRERLGGDALAPAAAASAGGDVVVASFDTGRSAGVTGFDVASG
jgi:outer membrane protein assembly factor BamB